jgi:hypothetical protein
MSLEQVVCVKFCNLVLPFRVAYSQTTNYKWPSRMGPGTIRWRRPENGSGTRNEQLKPLSWYLGAVQLGGPISLDSLNGQMISILKRLLNIARSHIGEAVSKGFDFPKRGFGFDRDVFSGKPGQKRQTEEITPKWPQQVVDDLSIFGLKPPSSLEEVKKVRNREAMKYHTDRFTGDPEKEETSNRIMQIYNTAFDRLEEWYRSSSATQSRR